MTEANKVTLKQGSVDADLAVGDDWASMEVQSGDCGRLEVFVRVPEPGAPHYAIAIQAAGGAGTEVLVRLDADTLEVLEVFRG